MCGGLLVASLVAGCPGDGDGSGSLTGALTVYAEAYCDALFHCAITGSDDRIAQRIAFQDEATCRRVATRFMRTDASEEVRHWRAMEAAGTLVVDGSKVEACREVGRSCGSFLNKCFDMFDGTVTPGGACAESDECAGDAHCVFDAAGEQCSGGGTCKARAAIGEACSSAEDCQADATGARECAHDGLQSRCLGVEHEVAGAGEPCGKVYQADVERLVTCSAGLWCDTPPASEVGDGLRGTCKAPLKLGAACDAYDAACEGNALCAPDGAGMRCKEVTLLHAGQACNVPDALALCDVYGGFTCDASNVCVALGDGSAGSRCDSTDFGELLPCNPGLRCVEESGTCESRHELGHSCEYDFECVSYHCGALTQKCEAEADACDDSDAARVPSG